MLLSSAIFTSQLFAIDFQQEKTSRYLRWQLKVSKDLLIVSKNNDLVVIETFDINAFDELVKKLQEQEIDKNYIKTLKFTKEYFPDRPAQIQMYLKDPTVELFKFYKPEDQLMVLDFWINAENARTVSTEETSKNESLDVATVKPIVEKKIETTFSPKAGIDQVKMWQSSTNQDSKDAYLDFRYGSTVIWPYAAIIPKAEMDIELGSKLPDAYYPVKTPSSVKDERESTLQVAVNFYKKEKFGLMKKTIDLFKQKYKVTNNEKVLFLYLEANTLLKSSLTNPGISLLQGGVARLGEIVNLTKDYELQKVCLRFQIQYAKNREDFQKILELSKDFFIKANENRDREMIYHSTRNILFALAQLSQTDKLEQFLVEPQVVKWLDTQEGLAYKYYTLYKRQEYQKLLSSFERLEKGLSQPIDASILFHVGESYFQLGEFPKAREIYLKMLKDHSYHSATSFVRVRLALVSELSEEPVHKTLTQYIDAIDSATMPQARIEAKIRYVGAAYNRKRNVTDGDKTLLGFLDAQSGEEKWIQGDCQILLWQTRLRSFIQSNHYNEALTYYSSLPLIDMTPVHKKVFEADGTEIVLGLIQQAYLKGDDSSVVKIWGLYQEKMGGRLKTNKQALYYVGSSTMRLGLNENSQKLLDAYKKNPEDDYPQWVKRDYLALDANTVQIKQLVAAKDWVALDAVLKENKTNHGNVTWGKVHMMIAKNQYDAAQKEIEAALVNKELLKTLIPADLSDLLEIYLTSIEHQEKGQRLESRIEAILAVMDSKMEVFKQVSERGKFLLLESYYREKNKDPSVIEAQLVDFKKSFPKSSYLPRISYVKALYMIGLEKKDEGTSLLNELVKNKTTPNHIREMAKNELNAMALP